MDQVQKRVSSYSEWAPNFFLSKNFCPKLFNSSTYVCELHAVTFVVQKWLHYLLGKHFVIDTDQKSLKELMNQIVQTLYQHLVKTPRLCLYYFV